MAGEWFKTFLLKLFREMDQIFSQINSRHSTTEEPVLRKAFKHLRIWDTNHIVRVMTN